MDEKEPPKWGLRYEEEVEKRKTYGDRLDGHWEGESPALRLVWMEMGMVVGEEVGVDRSLGPVGLEGELVPVLGEVVEVEGE